MSENDDTNTDDRTRFLVEFLTGETVEMRYGPEDTESLRETLDRSTTILGCPDCGDLAPVTGGIPSTMPQCPRCGDPLKGVTDVTMLKENDTDD